MTIQLLIEPTDVWLFRDGRPFNRGSDHRAESVFPPLPSVLQGVVRSHYIALHGGIDAYLRGNLPDVENVIGAPGKPAPLTFQMRGPFITRQDNGAPKRYVALPLDVYQAGGEYRTLTFDSPVKSTVLTDLDPACRLLWRGRDGEPSKADEMGGVWLDETGLLAYLQQQSIQASCVVKSKDLFEKEARIGIQRDDATRATVERQLYEAEFVRLCDNVGLYVEVDGLPDDWPESGVIGVGGEGRFGRFVRTKWGPLPTGQPNGGCFKVVFLTPTYFRGGWIPEKGDWSRWFDRPVKCVGAAVGRPVVLGGYDLASRRQKPSYRYVPAGSVYFFEGAAWPTAVTICDPFSDSNGTPQGFGQFSIGGY
jgi:CRISPR-associated protein Cmr3